MTARARMQGMWREVRGEFHAEEFVDSYEFVDNDETWHAHTSDDQWRVHRSRVTLKPARDFFLVTRTYGFDWKRNPSTTEYIVYLRDGKVYQLRGLARLDGIQDVSARKLRRVDSLPDGVTDAIDERLRRQRERELEREPSGSP